MANSSMLRWLGFIVRVLSAIALVAVFAFYIRSHFASDAIMFADERNDLRLVTWRGNVTFVWWHEDFRTCFVEEGWTIAHVEIDPYDPDVGGIEGDYQFLGFRICDFNDVSWLRDRHIQGLEVEFPLWFFAVLFAVLPCFGVVRFVIVCRQRLAGHCRQCGYDLRGSVSTACPECGAAKVDVTAPAIHR